MNQYATPSLGQAPARANPAAMTRMLALAAAVVVLLMLGIYVTQGIGQDPLQYIHTPAEYTAILLKNPPLLRAAIGLDNVFIVLYSSMFLGLGATLWQRSRSRPLLAAALVLLALSGLLDLLENMHFLSMIAMALQGMDIGQTHIEIQVWESLVKFHVSYLGLFLLGFALPTGNLLEKLLSGALRWVQLPIGLLIYLVPPDTARLLVFGRFTFFLVALLLIAAILGQRQYGSDEPA